MLSDLDLANLCRDCYINTDAFDRIIDADGVWVGIKHYPGCSAIAFRGSTTLLDWIRDFEGIMVDDPQLGGVEEGFRRGVRDVLAAAGAEITTKSPTLYITGHSLGAARALLFAGLVSSMGMSSLIKKITVFGSPRPGGQKLKNLLAPINVASYKNGDDPVTDVPVAFNLFPYTHPRDLVPVDISPVPGDEWGVLARHHSELYVAAMEKLYGQTTI